MSNYGDGIKVMMRELIFRMKSDILNNIDILDSGVLQDKIQKAITLPTVQQAEIILSSGKNISCENECI